MDIPAYMDSLGTAGRPLAGGLLSAVCRSLCPALLRSRSPPGSCSLCRFISVRVPPDLHFLTLCVARVWLRRCVADSVTCFNRCRIPLVFIVSQRKIHVLFKFDVWVCILGFWVLFPHCLFEPHLQDFSSAFCSLIGFIIVCCCWPLWVSTKNIRVTAAGAVHLLTAYEVPWLLLLKVTWMDLRDL